MIDPDLLLKAYRMGVFPMGDERGRILWFSPERRGILPIHGFKVPHGLKKALKSGGFEVRCNTAFADVVAACANRRETWITEEIAASYIHLHRIGHAHSVETWLDGQLVGGLYGVSLGGAFFGESMFHRTTNASKVALFALVQHLASRKFALLDTQWLTPHLAQFGGCEITRLEYLDMLEQALRLPVAFLPFTTHSDSSRSPYAPAS